MLALSSAKGEAQGIASSGLLSSKNKGFDKILLEAVEKALVTILGESGATAIKFYADTSVIVRNPEEFQELLRKLFPGSDAASRLLEDKILRTLVDFLQSYSITIPTREWKDKAFKQFILACKRQFEVSRF